MEFITEWDKWTITLHSGVVIEVWADGYQEIDGHYVFGGLVKTDEPPHEGLLVTNRTPSDPTRIGIASARIPIDVVADVHGGMRSTD